MATYNKEFKEEALKLSDELGIKKASAQLGLPYYTLSGWRNVRKANLGKTKVPDTEFEKRTKALEKKLAESERTVEILRDALGFFAKDQKR